LHIGGEAISCAVLVAAAIWPLAGASGQDLARLPEVVERVSPSVVSIVVEPAETAAAPAAPEPGGTAKQAPRDERSRKSGKPAAEANPAGAGADTAAKASKPTTTQGSGMALSADGYILTAASVVDKAARITVVLADDTRLSAELKGTDARTDLAVLKAAPPSPLTPVRFADSDRLRRGQPVFAIGNVFGLAGSVSLGVISGLGRDFGEGPYDDFIQTDAALNRGSNGGPLFNLDGVVVGMAHSVLDRGQGVGFAAPANLIAPVARQLVTSGAVVRGWLGVQIQNVSEEAAKSLGMARPPALSFGASPTPDPPPEPGWRSATSSPPSTTRISPTPAHCRG
jgi:serine protease Do